MKRDFIFPRKAQFRIEDNGSYKVGVDEIVGLKAEMKSILEPVRAAIQDKIYWTKVRLDDTEYKSRDGFIPSAHNLGGVEIIEVIPNCESHSFLFLDFGEFEPSTANLSEAEYDAEYEAERGDGFLDAKLRVWFKLESIENNTLKFYLYLGGGNGDAPYFRSHAETTYFEAEFTCKSVKGLKRAASKAIDALLKKIN